MDSLSRVLPNSSITGSSPSCDEDALIILTSQVPIVSLVGDNPYDVPVLKDVIRTHGALGLRIDCSDELVSQVGVDLVRKVLGCGTARQQEGIRMKPAPDSLFAAMQQLDADTDNTVYVGDSEVDVQTAQNAGVPCISVLWGFRDKELLLTNGARNFAHSPAEMMQMF